MGVDALSEMKKNPAIGAKSLVDGFGSRLVKTAFRLCGNRATAEDLAAKTLAKAVNDIGKFRGESESSLFSWLCTILVNFYRMDLRRKGTNALVLMSEVPEVEDTSPNPAEVLAAKTDAASVRAAVQKLSPAMREAIVLRYFNDLPEREVAAILGIKETAARVRIHAAKRKLRELLALTFSE